MVPTYSQFIARCPEFDSAPQAIVESCIAEAERQTPERVWGERQIDGIIWLAAHLLALSPQAKEMHISGTTQTLYQARREELERIVGFGPQVVGRW